MVSEWKKAQFREKLLHKILYMIKYYNRITRGLRGSPIFSLSLTGSQLLHATGEGYQARDFRIGKHIMQVGRRVQMNLMKITRGNTQSSSLLQLLGMLPSQLCFICIPQKYYETYSPQVVMTHLSIEV